MDCVNLRLPAVSLSSLNPGRTLSGSPTLPCFFVSLVMQHFALLSASPLPGHFVNLHRGDQLSDPIRLRAPGHFEALPGGKLVTWHPEEGHSQSQQLSGFWDHVIMSLFDMSSCYPPITKLWKLNFTCQTQFTRQELLKVWWRCEH